MIPFAPSAWLLLSALGTPPADPVAAAAEPLPPPPAELAAESEPATGGPRFREVAATAGIDFRYTFGDFAYDNLLESSGGGATWLDADGDGDLDLYLLQGAYLEGVSDPKGGVLRGVTNRLYCNEGGHFRDCTEGSGLDDPAWSMAAAAADFDDDGDTDLFVANYGPNRLFRNAGNGRFEDVAPAGDLVGSERVHGFPEWSVGGSWFDADRDGDLDLAVCNFLAFDPALLVAGREWEMPEPQLYRGQPSRLYLQESVGRFRDATAEAGILRPESRCMGITVLDLDGDGWLDLYQGNDHQPNFLFHARDDGRFEEIASTAGVAVNDQGIGTGSMHGTPGDIDGDGRLDLLVVDLRHGSLYRQRELLLFEDVTRDSGLAGLLDGYGQWGAGLADFDLDGDVDLFTANGVAHLLLTQRPVLAVNDGRGHFRDARAGAGPYFLDHRSGRGAAFADYDDDGDLDAIVSHVDHRATVALLENVTPREGHWIGFRLVGRAPRDAFGARVEIEAGERRQVRVVQPAASYLSGNDPRAHFGLGRSSKVVGVSVTWPSGRRERWTLPEVDRYWELREGDPELHASDEDRQP